VLHHHDILTSPVLLQGRGLNSSIAVYQDASGKAQERVGALAIGIGRQGQARV
jgi:ketol-acid reductoisomerase